jgi:hypothetical protein
MEVSESFIRSGGLKHIACGKMEIFNLQDANIQSTRLRLVQEKNSLDKKE